jgi:hypothetical protein
LPLDSICALRIGYDAVTGYWVFPERDSKRRIVGVVYRLPNGNKICEPHSRRGLTIPRGLDKFRHGPIYLPEGATDTAALHSVGAAAIGRPAAHASKLVKQWLIAILTPLDNRLIIVVGDRDKLKNGKRPGRDGAKDLALYLRMALRRPVRWALPKKDYKDIREQIVDGNWNDGLFMREAQP